MEPQKSLVLPISLTVLLSAIAFGAMGYYLASSKPAPVATITPLPAASATATAVVTALATSTPTAVASATASPAATTTYSTYTSTAYSYEYPKTATMPDKNSPIFVYGGITYSVETPSPAAKTSIETWIKDENVSATSADLTKYTKTVVSGETAYTFTGELRTYVMHGGIVYVIVGRESIVPSTKTSDATYAHLLSSFKFTK